MRLTHLSLENYRGFKKLELDFHPRLTVLVGTNGSGKSSVLDAVAMMKADIARHLAPVTSDLHFLSIQDLSIGAEYLTGALGVSAAGDGTRYVASIDKAGRYRQVSQQAPVAAWLGAPDFIIIYETTGR